MSSEREGDELEVRLDLRVPPGLDLQELLRDLAARPGLGSVKASGASFGRRQLVPDED